MSSRKILLNNNLVKEKKINLEQENILKEYFKDNYNYIIKYEYLPNLLFEKNLNKIKYINNTIKYLKNIKVRLLWFYKKIFVSLIDDKEKEVLIFNHEKYIERIDTFFTQQEKIKNTRNILSVISYQYIFLKYINLYLLQLSLKDNYYIHQELISHLPETHIETEISNFVSKYLDKYQISYKPLHPKKEEILSETDEIIIEFLKKLIKDINKKIQKLIINKHLGFHILTYGSYTSYILNKNVIYNDIDIYHTNPLKFLVLIIMIIYFLLGIETDIFKIPYILGHLSLRYKKVHFTDCIYMDKYTMDNIPTVHINNISFVDPLLQMLNNFRMMSELGRLNNINKDKANTCLKYSSLLNYINKSLNINYRLLKPLKHLNIEIIDNSFLLLDLKCLFEQFKDYEKIKDTVDFNYLVVSLCKPKYFFKLLNRNDIIISKQYFALFNEIVAEFHNKDKLNVLIGNNLNNLEIKEEFLVNDVEKEIEKFPDRIEKIIVNNNVLLMTNISTDVYIKNYISKEKCILNTEITDISKETILSSFVLYNVIKKKPIELISFYMKILLSFLLENNKKEEFKLLSKKKSVSQIRNSQNEPSSCNGTVYNSIYRQKKIKLSGNHLTFTINPAYLENIFFYNIQDANYYNYNHFIEKTNFN